MIVEALTQRHLYGGCGAVCHHVAAIFENATQQHHGGSESKGQHQLGNRLAGEYLG